MKIVLEKGDSKEQIMMAEAMLANKMVSAIEKQTYSCQKVQKSDDEVAKAVRGVERDFSVGRQWAAVYRILVDFCGWKADVAKFSKRMNALLRHEKLDYPCTYQAIQKALAENSILRQEFGQWKEYHAPKGFTPIWCKGKCRLMNQRGADGKVREFVFVADRYANQYQTDLFLGINA
jgi:hypothetical protein